MNQCPQTPTAASRTVSKAPLPLPDAGTADVPIGGGAVQAWLLEFSEHQFLHLKKVEKTMP